MNYIFEINDKSERKIRLSKKRWGEHIKLEHPDIQETNEIESTLRNPDRVIETKKDVYHYYRYFKHRNSKSKYLKVIVKYLNQHGFVITAYYVRDIRK